VRESCWRRAPIAQNATVDPSDSRTTAPDSSRAHRLIGIEEVDPNARARPQANPNGSGRLEPIGRGSAPVVILLVSDPGAQRHDPAEGHRRGCVSRSKGRRRRGGDPANRFERFVSQRWSPGRHPFGGRARLSGLALRSGSHVLAAPPLPVSERRHHCTLTISAPVDPRRVRAVGYGASDSEHAVSCGSQFALEPLSKSPRIEVVGAGPSGLTAADTRNTRARGSYHKKVSPFAYRSPISRTSGSALSAARRATSSAIARASSETQSAITPAYSS
jgi:hypothetical protein